MLSLLSWEALTDAEEGPLVFLPLRSAPGVPASLRPSGHGSPSADVVRPGGESGDRIAQPVSGTDCCFLDADALGAQ